MYLDWKILITSISDTMVVVKRRQKLMPGMNGAGEEEVRRGEERMAKEDGLCQCW